MLTSPIIDRGVYTLQFSALQIVSRFTSFCHLYAALQREPNLNGPLVIV